ncbi:MAG: hypothetical protein H7144_10785 [Burkholderiales bacterium]|nr:hypothetical protein [Phycisphaerae bacterium]
MTQTTDPIVQRADIKEVRQQLKDKHVCPFCGVIRADHAQPCPRCTMDDTANTRSATRQRIGPWFVMQARNPSAPGMKFATMLTMVKKGHVTPRSIVRGPTSHQLWTFAAKVRGLSRELGLCFHCGEAVDATSPACVKCGRSQEPPSEPDALLEPQTAPEMQVGAGGAQDTGMDGGTSLDLQVDDIPGLSLKPTRPAAPTKHPVPALSSQASRPGTPLDRARQEESILTARELAAAFQLDFKPKQPAPSTSRVATAAPAAAVTATRSSRPGLFKIIASIGIVLLTALAVLAALRPDFRDNAVAWLGTKWGGIKQSLDAPAPATKRPAAPVATDPKTARVEPKVEPQTLPQTLPKSDPKPTTPKVIERTAPPAAVVTVPVPEPKSVEPLVQTPVRTPVSPPVQSVETKVEPKPVSPRPDPLPVRVVDDANDAGLTIEQATTLAQDLRKAAIDLEGADWRQALRLYQRIERLPRDAWPSDLQLKLDRARARAQ